MSNFDNTPVVWATSKNLHGFDYYKEFSEVYDYDDYGEKTGLKKRNGVQVWQAWAKELRGYQGTPTDIKVRVCSEKKPEVELSNVDYVPIVKTPQPASSNADFPDLVGGGSHA